MNIIAVELDNKKFIIHNALKNYSYNSDVLPELFFDDKKPEKFWCEDWYIIHQYPNKVQREVRQSNINHRFELIDETMQSEKMPLVIKKEDAILESDGYEWKPKLSIYRSLYKEVSDKCPPVRENVDFNFQIVMKVKDAQKPDDFSYDVQKTRYTADGLTQIQAKDLQHQIIDKLLFPQPLLPQMPCKLSSKQTYDIVRQYVKQNINYKVARITSDYDFCFTAVKIIPLSEQVKYKVDVNWSLFEKKRRPKIEIRYKSQREVECFEMSPEGYQGYTIITGFEGKNQKDLQEKIDTYCKDLIDFINIPVTDCPHCQGLGVIKPVKT